jgi:hypothetical protein
MKRELWFVAWMGGGLLSAAGAPVGPRGPVGVLANLRVVDRLEITEPGVYENIRVDARGRGGNIVKITADDVTLRNCEIFNGAGNGIGVFGTRVVIERCRIHHLLRGTFAEQSDAHGITGRWGEVTIRDCEISQVSGDCVQFDPDRGSRGRVTIEHCRLWAEPLAADAGGFRAGESPGENAFDSKTLPDGERCGLIIRNCHLHGWSQPSQIQNRAALNLKEHIDAVIEQCVFDDNEIAIRARGPGSRGGAHVVVRDCAIYRAAVGVRVEDAIEKLKLEGVAFGGGVVSRVAFHNGRDLPGYAMTGEREAPPMDRLLREGFPRR